MKKIIAILVALSAVGYLSAIDVNENLSINGFIDGSYHDDDRDADHDLGLDEVEIDFLFNAGGVSGEVHVDTNDASANHTDHEGLGIEQAFISYTLEGGLGVTFGRFDSNLGLEREDPGGLYTYSRAYGDGSNAYNLGDVDTNWQEGLRLGYSSDVLSAAATFYDGSALDDADLDVEISIGYTGIENLVLTAGMQFDNAGTGTTESDVLNVTALFSTGKALIGLEYTEVDSSQAAVDESEAFMVLIDYDISDKLGVALRYSDAEDADAPGLGTNSENYEKFTIAPNYAITESLGAILEYSDVDTSDALGGDVDANEISLELTFTF